MSPKLAQLNLNRQSSIDEKNNLKLAFSVQHNLANIQIKLNKSMELSATFRDMETFIRGLQDQICNGLEAFEPIQRFQQDIWEREQGGGGWTRILSGGQTFGKAGVNISSIHGEMTKELASQLKVEEGLFGACGLSLVIHPNSPQSSHSSHECPVL